MLISKIQSVKLLVMTLLLISSTSTYSQTVINSLEALSNYLDDDNANVKLAPGTYTITADNAENYGMYEDHYRTVYTLFPFTGNNSTYDFTGVTINVETEVLSKFGNVDVYEFRLAGNNIVLKNLTLTDVGSVHDAPGRGANSIVMDGKNNVVDGFTVTAKGSSPYGYGDIFGKGGGAMVSLKKHCGILIRGDYNTLKNTKMIHRAFGHCVYFQAASHPTVDGCYIEGEMRSTDDILKEEGTGSTADDLDFMTVWGYKLPPGFMIALCEAGIRSYDAGETFIDGVSYGRGTNDVTVLNTVVKNTRTACTISQGSGDRYVENVTSIGNEFGFGIGSGKVVNCYADAAYGSIFGADGSVEGSITLIEPENGYYNGSKCVASVTGGTLTLYTNTTNVPADLAIKLGSDRSFRHQEGSNLMYQVTTDFSGGAVYNHSSIAIDLGPGSDNVDIYTCGSVTDNGSRNSINYWDDCDIVETVCNDFNAYTAIQAEAYCNELGVDIANGNVGYIENGDWIMFEDVDFGSGAESFEARVSSENSGGAIELHLGSVSGTLIGTCSVSSTGSWTTWATESCAVTGASGVQDLYLVFKGESGYLLDIDLFKFTEVEGIVSSFTPDPNKTYHIDSAFFSNTRLAATGNTEDIYIASSSTTGSDVEWKFVAKGNGYWHIQLASGGSMPRLRSDNAESADMQATTSSGDWTQFEITEGAIAGSYFLTLPNGPGNHVRLQIDKTGAINMVGNTRNGTWESFTITEANDSNNSTSCDLPYASNDFEVTDETVNKTSDSIDISCASSVSISMDIASAGNMETDQDYLNIYYQVDGGNWQVLTENDGSISDRTVSINGISGNSLSLRYQSYTSYGDEIYTVSNILVKSSSGNKAIETLEASEVLIYPNPVRATTTIANAANSTINVYDINGRVVLTKTISSESETIDLDGLAPGIYYGQVIGQTTLSVTKIVKTEKE